MSELLDVCSVAELPPGARRIVRTGGRSIGIFNVDGLLYAIRNTCPHQGAPLCLGSVKGMALPSMPGEYHWAREGEILRCPWHGWEFDLLTGRSICDPQGIRVKAYDVTVEPGPHEPLPLAAETYPVTIEDRTLVLHL